VPLRRLLSAFAISASLIVAACGTPPDKELHEAQAAIDAARTAGADRFATEEFTAAQTALAKANDAVAQRDYRLALNNALDARERAQTAAKEAAGHLAAAKREADIAMKDGDAALHDAHAKLKAAETARVPAATLNDARTSIAAADTALQEARTLAERGDFQGAKDRALKTTTTLRRISLDLQTEVSDAAHRRRPAPRKR
jgi:chitodextrinase